MSDFCVDKLVTVRKQHKCEWCMEAILKGDKAVKVAGVHHGDWSAYYLHPECKEPCWDYCSENDGEFMPGDGERPRVTSTEAIR